MHLKLVGDEGNFDLALGPELRFGRIWRHGGGGEHGLVDGWVGASLAQGQRRAEGAATGSGSSQAEGGGGLKGRRARVGAELAICGRPAAVRDLKGGGGGIAVNKYYDLSTSFYEYGWGESFHFAHRWNGESLRESIKRHEHFLALQLELKPGMKVLDVGCGIGGPLREIARFSSTSVTGLNNNDYQITRGKELNRLAGLSGTCDFVKADFMNMPFSDNTFDAVYAIEATCHAPDPVGCCKEIYRVLKPGQCFAVYEWCITDHYDPNNATHKRIKDEIELGNGLPDIRSTQQCLQAVKDAGFEVIWDKDLAVDSPLPWYLPLDPSRFSLSSFRLTTVGRLVTRNMVKALEYIGLAPEGSQRVSNFLEKAADGLVEGGKKEIFTPMYFVVRKPLSE